MAFDTVVFGSYIKGTGFTDGSSIETGGLRCFIKPTGNIGNAPFERPSHITTSLAKAQRPPLFQRQLQVILRQAHT